MFDEIKNTRVFILVKTYPTLSAKYDELVCTAGITEDGKWVRIYPLPFRKLDLEQKYKKFQWISIPLIRNKEDIRPESHKVQDLSKIVLEERVENWDERRQILSKTPVFDNVEDLISRRSDISLAIFKPKTICDFVAEKTDSNWSKEKLDQLHAKSKQLSLFQTEEEVRKEFSLVKKVPYKFFYKFTDETNKVRKLMIEDWETGMLYWNCLEYSKDEAEAIEKVRKKYYDEFIKKDIFLFLGTTKQFHNFAPNPFVIVGVFPPPKQHQKLLF